VLSHYKSWLFISLVICSIMLIAIKTAKIYHSQTQLTTSQHATDLTPSSPDIDSLIIANKSSYNEQMRKIEREKAKLEALDASINDKIQALKAAENDVLELLESTDIDE